MSLFQPFDLRIKYKKTDYEITAVPQVLPVKDGVPLSFDLIINGQNSGYITFKQNSWESDDVHDKGFVQIIGDSINGFYKYKIKPL